MAPFWCKDSGDITIFLFSLSHTDTRLYAIKRKSTPFEELGKMCSCVLWKAKCDDYVIAVDHEYLLLKHWCISLWISWKTVFESSMCLAQLCHFWGLNKYQVTYYVLEEKNRQTAVRYKVKTHTRKIKLNWPWWSQEELWFPQY